MEEWILHNRLQRTSQSNPQSPIPNPFQPMSNQSDQSTTIRQAPASIRWRSWPLCENAARTCLVTIGLLVAVVLIRWVSGWTYLALLGLLALLVALWRFFLPVEFELSDQGVHQRVFGRQRHIRWQAIARYEVCSAGVLLLPDADRSAMAPFRGLYLPWSTHRDEVLAQVRHYLAGRDEP